MIRLISVHLIKASHGGSASVFVEVEASDADLAMLDDAYALGAPDEKYEVVMRAKATTEAKR